MTRTFWWLAGFALLGCSPAVVDLSQSYQGEESPGLVTHYELLPADAYTPAMLEEAVSAYRANEPQVLFLHFEGEQIVGCANHCSDARTNRSWLLGGTRKIPKFDHKPYGADREVVLAEIKKRVEALFAGFNVQVVTARPQTGNYTMVVIGGGTDLRLERHSVSTSPVDCANQNRGDVGFVFGNAYVFGLDMLSVAIAHEAGHTFGLAHVQQQGDVMNRTLSWPARFSEGPVAISEAACPGVTTQIAHETLRQNLGITLGATPPTPAAPVADLVRPEAGVLWPSPDALFPPYTEITIEASVSDDRTMLASVELIWYWNGARKVASMVSGDRYYFTVLVGEGERDFAIRAVDLAGNETITPAVRLWFR